MRISEGAYRNIQQMLSTIPRFGGAGLQEMVKQDVLECLREEYGPSFSPQKIDLPSIQLFGRSSETELIPAVRIWMPSCPLGPTEDIIPQRDLEWDWTLKVFGAISKGSLLCFNLYVVNEVKPFLFESADSISSHVQEGQCTQDSYGDETQQVLPGEEREHIQIYHMLSTRYYDWMLFSNPQETSDVMGNIAASPHELAIQRLPRQMLFAPFEDLPNLSITIIDQLKTKFKRNKIIDLVRCPEFHLFACDFTAEQVEEIKRSLALLNLRLGMSSGF